MSGASLPTLWVNGLDEHSTIDSIDLLWCENQPHIQTHPDSDARDERGTSKRCSTRRAKAKIDLASLHHKELLTLEEVAALCSVGKRTIETAVGRGDLASVKGFGGRRVTRAQLDAYIRSLEIRAGFRRPK